LATPKAQTSAFPPFAKLYRLHVQRCQRCSSGTSGQLYDHFNMIYKSFHFILEKRRLESSFLDLRHSEKILKWPIISYIY